RRELLARLIREEQAGPEADATCRGTLLSRAQNVIACEHWVHGDPRFCPVGRLTERQREDWNRAMKADTEVVIPFPSESPPAGPPAGPLERPARSSLLPA